MYRICVPLTVYLCLASQLLREISYLVYDTPTSTNPTLQTPLHDRSFGAGFEEAAFLQVGIQRQDLPGGGKAELR